MKGRLRCPETRKGRLICAAGCCSVCCVCCGLLAFCAVLIEWSFICAKIIEQNPWRYISTSKNVIEGQVVFFGDSNVDYWDGHGDGLSYICSNCGGGDTWPAVQQIFGSGATVYNLAEEGTTCNEWVESGAFTEMLSKFKPSKLVLPCGQNDLYYGNGCATMYGKFDGSSVEDTFAYLDHMVKKIGAVGGPPRIFYFSPVNDPSSSDDFSKYQEYNACVKNRALTLATTAKQSNKLPPLVFIDTFDGFKDVSCQSKCFGEDDTHMKTEGYTYWKD